MAVCGDCDIGDRNVVAEVAATRALVHVVDQDAGCFAVGVLRRDRRAGRGASEGVPGQRGRAEVIGPNPNVGVNRVI